MANFEGHMQFYGYEVLSGPSTGVYCARSGGHGNQVPLVMPSKGWAGMTEETPTFTEIMMKELGGEDDFDAFMSDWGKTFKTGHTETVKILPEASDYGTD